MTINGSRSGKSCENQPSVCGNIRLYRICHGKMIGDSFSVWGSYWHFFDPSNFWRGHHWPWCRWWGSASGISLELLGWMSRCLVDGNGSIQDGAPQWCLLVCYKLVYKPWNNPHEYYSYIYHCLPSTIEIQPFINQLNAIDWGPHPVPIDAIS